MANTFDGGWFYLSKGNILTYGYHEVGKLKRDNSHWRELLSMWVRDFSDIIMGHVLSYLFRSIVELEFFFVE